MGIRSALNTRSSFPQDSKYYFDNAPNPGYDWSAMTRALTILLALTMVTCRQYPFRFQPDSAITGQTTEVTIDRPSESDILFVIDSSGSMKTKQDNLKRNISLFIDTLATSVNKFQIAVTTTDNTSCTDVPPTPNPWDGKCGRLLSPDGTDPIIRRADFADNAALANRFRSTVDAVGVLGSPYEEGLKSAFRAVSPDLAGPGKPNAGFVRPNAQLVIVILSDETDCSFSLDNPEDRAVFVGSSLQSGQSCYEFKDQLEPPSAWAQRITTVKGRRRLVSVGVISAAVAVDGVLQSRECSVGSDGQPTDQCSCFFDNPLAFCKYTKLKSPPASNTSPSTCADGNCCTSLGDERYFQFADAFVEREKDSVCRAEYNETMFRLANIANRDCFALDPPPANDDVSNVEIKRRRGDASAPFVLVPRIQPEEAATGSGWYFVSDVAASGEKTNEVCLAGDFQRKLGDTFKIFVVASTQGSNSEIPAD